MSELSIIAPQPYGLTFMQWTALIAEQLARYGVSESMSEGEWKAWVCALFFIPELAAKNIPTPDLYRNWQTWAERFVEAVR